MVMKEGAIDNVDNAEVVNRTAAGCGCLVAIKGGAADLERAAVVNVDGTTAGNRRAFLEGAVLDSNCTTLLHAINVNTVPCSVEFCCSENSTTPAVGMVSLVGSVGLEGAVVD